VLEEIFFSVAFGCFCFLTLLFYVCAVPVTPDFVYLVTDCPHDWLFPQCAAVVSPPQPLFFQNKSQHKHCLASIVYSCSMTGDVLTCWLGELRIFYTLHWICLWSMMWPPFFDNSGCNRVIMVSEFLCRFIMVGQAQQQQVLRLQYYSFPLPVESYSLSYTKSYSWPCWLLKVIALKLMPVL
jgi:hypothetical protein